MMNEVQDAVQTLWQDGVGQVCLLNLFTYWCTWLQTQKQQILRQGSYNRVCLLDEVFHQ